MNLVSRSPAAHWYGYDPTVRGCFPCHELPKKDGKGMKAVTLREARELGLLWSVTRVCSVLAKPALENWKCEQAIMAALTLPRREGEGIDAFAKRVVVDMSEQSSTARDFGTALHRDIERELSGEVTSWTCEKHMKSVRAWLKEHCEDVHASEIVVGDPALGVAGKLDLDCTLKMFGRCIVDFKTQKVKESGPVFYSEWPLQLACYRHCRQLELPGQNFEIVSVIIDSNEAVETPEVHAKVWLGDVGYFQMFERLVELCCYINGYDPREKFSAHSATEGEAA